jgi:hypothetical protein
MARIIPVIFLNILIDASSYKKEAPTFFKSSVIDDLGSYK